MQASSSEASRRSDVEMERTHDVSNLPTTVSSTLTTVIQRKPLRHLLIDLMIFIVLTIPIIVCEFGIEPFRRGFFCDDMTIQYPYRGNTVTPAMLGILVGVVPIVIIVAVELASFYERGEINDNVEIFGWSTPSWLAVCSRQFGHFIFGLLLTFNATEVAKYTIGRLRPHFMDVCQPQLLDGSPACSRLDSSAPRYIEDYVCPAYGFSVADVRQARLSFPSGHSSLSFYAMVFIAIYLQYRLLWERFSKLARHFMQFVVIMLAWYTALSRVTDNWHHWSDVLVGSLIGALGAIITAQYIAKWHKEQNKWLSIGDLKESNISRQDTAVTLQDVITGTPPPYSLSKTDSEVA